jgi:hypothetical protein
MHMAISARLSSKIQLALARYCKAHGLTKTEALERGIQLLLRYEGERAIPPGHPLSGCAFSDPKTNPNLWTR